MAEFESPSKGNLDGLVALAQTYFDAAHDMDAEKFATIFHEASSVTRTSEDGAIVVTPIDAWLGVVKEMRSPRENGAARADEVLSISLVRDMALLKLRLRIPPREVTDLLSCFFLNGRWKIVQKVFHAETIGG